MENIYVVYQHIGYKKDITIKNKLIVDEKVAEIVRKIFEMYATGHGSKEIAQYLNKNKYLSPSGYRKTGKVQDMNKTNYNWNEVTLCNMLRNEVYIGNTIQNKKSVISYKIKKTRIVEKENQIRVNNTHQAIIEKSVFEKVQCILEKRGTNPKLKYDYLLRGMIYCHHCKSKLQIVLKKNSKSRAKAHPYIICSNYKQRGCYPQNLNYEKFEKNIINIVKNIVQKNIDKENLYQVYEKIQNKISDTKNNKKEIEQIEKTIVEINNNLDKMYIDKLRNIISEEDYIRISNRLISDRTSLIKQKEEIKNKSHKRKISKEEIEKIIENFLKLEKIDEIFLYRLINKIEIDKDKNVYIYFKFSKPK